MILNHFLKNWRNLFKISIKEFDEFKSLVLNLFEWKWFSYSTKIMFNKEKFPNFILKIFNFSLLLFRYPLNFWGVEIHFKCFLFLFTVKRNILRQWYGAYKKNVSGVKQKTEIKAFCSINTTVEQLFNSAFEAEALLAMHFD